MKRSGTRYAVSVRAGSMGYRIRRIEWISCSLFIKSQVESCFVNVAVSAVSHPPPKKVWKEHKLYTNTQYLHTEAWLLLTRIPRVGANFCEKRNLKCFNGQIGSKTIMRTHMINKKICAPTARCSQYSCTHARMHASGFRGKPKQLINTQINVPSHLWILYFILLLNVSQTSCTGGCKHLC